MKKITGMSVVFILGIIIIFVLPVLLNAFIPSSTLTKLKEIKYTNSVFANGTSVEKNKSEVKLETPVIPQEVYFSAGDVINAGDVIAIVDRQQTINVIRQLSANSGDNNIDENIFAAMVGGSFDKSLINDSEDVMELIPEKIVSTVSGTVTGVGIARGELAMTGTPSVTVSDLNEILINIAINEANISEVEEGQEVIVTGTGFKDRSYNANIIKISPTARKQINGISTETVVDAVALVNNADEYLKPGFTVKCEIYTNKESKINIVPYESIMQDEDGIEFVYIYEEGRTIRKNVTTGVEVISGVQIKDGLEADSYIIADASKVNKNGYVRVTGVY